MGRNISLFWRHSHDPVQEYLAQRVAAGIKAKDQVFASTYDALRIFLGRLGKDVLKKPVYPHLFRHSSATFYAAKLNRQELCYRYGWRFSSNMPDIYISRSGMENKELDEKFTATEFGQLKDELVKKDQSDKIKEERIRVLEQKLAVIEKHFDTIAAVKQSGVTSRAIETAISRKSDGTNSAKR